jgi:hypothetical protein
MWRLYIHRAASRKGRFALWDERSGYIDFLSVETGSRATPMDAIATIALQRTNIE